ncbi:MAG: LuxR C-terminal-related transcriptional regulator [Candidatus Thiodiazotropha sp.]
MLFRLMTLIEAYLNWSKTKIKIPVIYMTGHGDIPLAVEAMSKGAITFLEKPLDFTLLNSAIATAFSAYNKINQKIFTTSSNDEEYTDRLKSLTCRESQILKEIVAGKMNKVIALDLGISVKTVELHRSRVMSKMQAKTAADLVKMVLTEKC